MITTIQEFWGKVGEFRCPVGPLLFKAGEFGTVAEVAARSGANVVDFRQFARQRIGGSRYVGFTPDTVLTTLREIQNCGEPRKWIVTNFDLAIARLKLAHRTSLWSSLISQVTPNSKTAMVLAMPDEDTAVHLLPSGETLKEWIQTSRALRVSPTPT